MKNIGRLPAGRKAGHGAGVSISLQVDPVQQAKLEKALSELPDAVFMKVIVPAVLYAFQPVLTTARRYYAMQTAGENTERTGLIAKALGMRRKVYKRTGTAFVAMGAMPGFRDPHTGEDPQNLVHLLEFGTRPHAIGKGSHSRGRRPVASGRLHPGARAFPFMRPALDTEKHTVLSRYREKVLRGVEKQAKKLGRASGL